MMNHFSNKGKISTIILSMLILLVSCGSPKSTTEEAAADSTIQKVETVQPVQAKPALPDPDAERADGSLPLTLNNLSRSTFISNGIAEIDFETNGTLTFSDPIDFEENMKEGTWKLSGSSLTITIGRKTVNFEIDSFTKEELNMTTSDSFAEKLTDDEKQHGQYKVRLHRTYLKPYKKDQIAGEWKDGYGKAAFGAGDLYSYTAADSTGCSSSGTWLFSEGYVGVEITQSGCPSSQLSMLNYDIVRVAQSLMILKTEEQGFEVYWHDK